MTLRNVLAISSRRRLIHHIHRVYAPSCNENSGLEGTDERREIRAGHVEYIGEMRNAYNVLMGTPEGKEVAGQLKIGSWTIEESFDLW